MLTKKFKYIVDLDFLFYNYFIDLIILIWLANRWFEFVFQKLLYSDGWRGGVKYQKTVNGIVITFTIVFKNWIFGLKRVWFTGLQYGSNQFDVARVGLSWKTIGI